MSTPAPSNLSGPSLPTAKAFAATAGSAMGAGLWLQVEMAAKGCVSGTLREWPMLARALRELGHNLPPSTPAATLRALCRAAYSPSAEVSERGPLASKNTTGETRDSLH